jgi:ribA/ribD-fused uncharacterized protein
MNVISEFKGHNFFLSNFYISTVVYGGLTFTSSEAAFQSAKVIDLSIKRHFTELSPSEAKALGRLVRLRDDWEEVKYEVMKEIVRDKFNRSNKLKCRLIDTGNAELIEGNTWNDEVWGVHNGKGSNWLGKILMEIRQEITSDVK